MKEIFLCKYGEIVLKGQNRRNFESMLVKELRRRKQRDEKPFALMCRDADCVRKLCVISTQEEEISGLPLIEGSAVK